MDIKCTYKHKNKGIFFVIAQTANQVGCFIIKDSVNL